MCSSDLAYREFMARENLSAKALADDNRKIEPYIDAPHVFAWYARRIRDIHDVWHVLTGYGRDALGEACVVALSLPQTGSKGFGLIAIGAAVEMTKARTGYPCARAVFEAWRRGRKAAWLSALGFAMVLLNFVPISYFVSTSHTFN